MNHELLHEKAISHAKTFHKAEADLIDVLQEVDAAKIFLNYHCTSLFEYCLKHLKLSEANTSSFICVARKSKEIPALKEAIRKQEITVSKARRITSVLTKDNSTHWLDLAKTLPKPQLEKEVAKVAPQTLTPERAKYVAEDRIQLNIGVSEKTMTKLRRVQDLLSQKKRKPASMEESLEELLDLFLTREDPVEKAKRALTSKPTSDVQHGPGPRKRSSQLLAPRQKPIHQHTQQTKPSRQIPAQTKHQIHRRDGGQCTHVHNAQRCQNKRWLEVHHQIPLSVGGSNNLQNLTTLCWSHHRMRHNHH